MPVAGWACFGILLLSTVLGCFFVGFFFFLVSAFTFLFDHHSLCVFVCVGGCAHVYVRMVVLFIIVRDQLNYIVEL